MPEVKISSISGLSTNSSTLNRGVIIQTLNSWTRVVTIMNINYWNHIESMEPNKYSQKTSCHFLTSLTLGQLYAYIYIYTYTKWNVSIETAIIQDSFAMFYFSTFPTAFASTVGACAFRQRCPSAKVKRTRSPAASLHRYCSRPPKSVRYLKKSWRFLGLPPVIIDFSRFFPL